MKTNILQITEVKKIKQKNMWTLRILKEPMKYQTIGGFLFRLFGVSTNVHLKYLTAFLPNRCYLLGGLSVGNLI
jgi:hypothetical protein